MNYKIEVEVKGGLKTGEALVEVVVIRESVPYLNSWDEPDYHDVRSDAIKVEKATPEALAEAFARAIEIIKQGEED